MTRTEPTFAEVMDQIFQHIDENDINHLKEWIDAETLEGDLKTNFDKSFQDFQTDLTSLKATEDEDKVDRRIYAYVWELILLISALKAEGTNVTNFSFQHSGREKDLLLEVDDKQYHIEITSKDDITRSKAEKKELVKDTSGVAKELSKKNITDNAVFDYNLSNKFDIPDTEKVLFIYQMKSSFFHLEDYIKSINDAVSKFEFKYILFNNLSSTAGRFVREYPEKEIKAWHNFEKKDTFLNNLMESILIILKQLKDTKGDTHDIQ